MLKFLRRKGEAAPSGRFQVPDGQIVFGIGDIHGCRSHLELLLERISDEISYSSASAKLIFLGDYVDRGPDSAGVLERLASGPLPGDSQAFLIGNHEEAMLAVLDGDMESLSGWLRYGGRETLESYGIGRAEVMQLGADLPERMREAIPASHVDFLRRCQDYVLLGDYLFVHAGIRPGVPLSEQDTADLRWIRSGFLDDDSTDHGMMVVHGHTIVDEPETMSNRIGIDTGCFQTGRLTALVLEGRQRRFLSTS